MDPKKKALLEEIGGLTKQYDDLLAAHPSGDFTDEDKGNLTKWFTKTMELKGQVATLESEDDERKQMAETSDWLSRPQYRQARHGEHVNADDDGRKALIGMGWECKNGVLYAPTSLGPQMMYREDVLLGKNLPFGDAKAMEFINKQRRGVQMDYKPMYANWVRNLAKFGDRAAARSELNPDEQKALSEGTDTEGGVLVPPDVTGEMLMRTGQRALMRRYAMIITTTRDEVKWFRLLPHPDSTLKKIYSDGFIGGWDVEVPVFSDTDPGFGDFAIAIKKLRVATKLSNDFISDSIIDILTLLSTQGSKNMALTEDAGFFVGDGGPLQPYGLLNTPGVGTYDLEGTTSNTISNTSASAGSSPKLVQLIYQLISQYAERAQLVMRRNIEGKIRGLVDANGRFMWPLLENSGFGPPSGQGRAPRSIMTYPVENTEWMPDEGTNLNKVIAYGDLGEYRIAQRASITTTVLRERFADTDQTGIILWERVGGALENEQAFIFGTV